MSSIKPSQTEEEYFARQEIDKKRRLAAELKEKMAATERESLRKCHFMRCSKCGLELNTITFRGFIIEKCFTCGAVVLDDDEFEKLAGTEEGIISAIAGLFK